ncbi:FkbM family methyltransferase [Asaia prunellae]|uniref:FkbM family methyltransferase n=1 Tax=Asaia prunellae TaxID=610245 RepID=UPI00055743C9|nr:FkbM family methyltransferase [Asaia prunellae]
MSSTHETPDRSRKAAFVLASTDHGTMIINRFDYHRTGAEDHAYGVGFSLLEDGHFEPGDVLCLKDILSVQRRLRGQGVVALDIGANLGVHTIEWAKHMSGWGNVLAIEAQERIFYALCGNISINNCFNARAANIAAGNQVTTMKIPVPDYCSPGSFGSLELQPRPQTEFIGQSINYAEHAMAEVSVRTIDSFALPRLDLIKIDVEGMEMAVLEGAINTIKTLRPVMFIEHIKIEKDHLISFMREMDYTLIDTGMNSVAFHREDPIHECIRVIPAS